MKPNSKGGKDRIIHDIAATGVTFRKGRNPPGEVCLRNPKERLQGLRSISTGRWFEKKPNGSATVLALSYTNTESYLTLDFRHLEAERNRFVNNLY
jgi:hypothetical protein